MSNSSTGGKDGPYQQLSQQDKLPKEEDRIEGQKYDLEAVHHDLTTQLPHEDEYDDVDYGVKPQRLVAGRSGGFQPLPNQDDDNDSLNRKSIIGDVDGESLMLSFDEDEEDDGLSRYAFFVSEEPKRSASKTTVTDSKESFPSRINTASFRPNSVREYIQSSRLEARRRRTERLLTRSDSCGTRLLDCLVIWCDLTDRGILLMIFLIILFVVAYQSLDAERHRGTRRNLLAIGIPIILFRVFWRTVYWWLWGRLIEKRRQETMQIYDGRNRENETCVVELQSTFDNCHVEHSDHGGPLPGDREGADFSSTELA